MAHDHCCRHPCKGCLRHTARFNRRLSLVAAFAVSTFLLATTARADVAALGSVPDAGPALDVPVELAAGQPAPFHGYELSDARAEQLLANQQAAPAETSEAPLVIAVVAFVAGALLGGYVVAKVK